MKKKFFISVLLVFILIVSGLGFSSAPVIGDKINDVLYTDIETFLNNHEIESFNINGNTAIFVSDLKKFKNITVKWDGDKRQVDISEDSANNASDSTDSNIIKRVATDIQSNKPKFEISPLTKVHGVSLNNGGEYSSMDYEVSNNHIILNDFLPMGKTLKLEIYGNDYQQVHYTIKPMDLPAIEDFNRSDEGGARYLLVPPMPEEGFNFPMLMLVGPSNHYKHSPSKKHLFIDTLNLGEHTGASDFYKDLDVAKALGSAHTAYSTAFDLDMPMILALIPRTGIHYRNDFVGESSIYEAAFDRDTIFYKELLKGELYSSTEANDVKKGLEELGFEPEDFYDIDEQVLAMGEFAKEYFEDNGISLEEKYFMCGFSASGTFSDRLTTLHPKKFKAVFSGAAGDDFVLPMAKEENENLILPLGTYDYEEAVGRPFSLEDYNNVARIIHMGKKDENDVFPFSGCYGDEERRIAYKLWGETTLERAYDLMDSFKDSGGNGIIILDVGQEHGMSNAMEDYKLEFFLNNVGDNTPVVYPTIRSNNLEYQLYK